MIEVELNDKQRQILAYDFRAQGLEHVEIARRLSITVAALSQIFQHPALETKQFQNLRPFAGLRSPAWPHN